jgi:transcriptional regulator with XRE-family HTH domain
MNIINKNINEITLLPMTLKSQLKMYLEHMDMTAAQLSRKSGVSQQVLSTWLRGGEPKKMSQVKSVADCLGITVDQLCFGSGVNGSIAKSANLEALLSDQWISGFFEVKLRRVNKREML